MPQLLTCAQMRALEGEAIASGRVTGLALMERAGRGVVAALCHHWPALATGAHRATVLAGPGNNGGDGFVIARRLRDLGWKVEVLFLGTAAKLGPDARRMHDLWAEGGAIAPLTAETAREGARPDLLVDAIFGIGLTRPIPLDVAQAVHAVLARDGTHPARLVAVDCPSGFDADRGEFLIPTPPDDASPTDWHAREAAPRILLPDLTVTFHAPKIGHMLTEFGALSVVDIGLGARAEDARDLLAPATPDGLRLVNGQPGAPETKRWAQALLRQPSRHKYERGHVLVLAGGPGHGGAARMAARAALRVGAGLVTLGAPHAAMAENAARLDAIMLREIGTARALAATLEDPRLSALVIGPGLGVGEATRDLVHAALTAPMPDGHDQRRIVLDADALTSFAQDPDALFALIAAQGQVTLTPHDGEFARLFPDLAPAARHLSRLEAVREASARSGATILLKGPATLIARPDGATSLHPALRERAAPMLATAGAGDVLAGMIAGLLASPGAGETLPLIELAVWLHTEAARAFGPGLIAEDLPEQLPGLFRLLEL